VLEFILRCRLFLLGRSQHEIGRFCLVHLRQILELKWIGLPNVVEFRSVVPQILRGSQEEVCEFINVFFIDVLLRGGELFQLALKIFVVVAWFEGVVICRGVDLGADYWAMYLLRALNLRDGI